MTPHRMTKNEFVARWLHDQQKRQEQQTTTRRYAENDYHDYVCRRSAKIKKRKGRKS